MTQDAEFNNKRQCNPDRAIKFLLSSILRLLLRVVSNLFSIIFNQMMLIIWVERPHRIYQLILHFCCICVKVHLVFEWIKHEALKETPVFVNIC